MPKWTKEHAKLIGRIIFADFLEFPLKKYKDFIEGVERTPLFDKLPIVQKRLSSAKVSQRTEGYSPKVIAEIRRSGKDFTIRYTHEGFNKIYIISDNSRLTCPVRNEISNGVSEYSRLFYKLRRITSRNKLTYKILKGIIEHQQKYLRTGNLSELVSFSQVQLTSLLNTYDLQLTTKIDISWISRLINKISVITPSGEEKPLKWFFQTQKDVKKRLIKCLFDKENEDIESGRQKKPLTDNQIRAKLESEYGVELSRHSVGHCRKDMGIPSAKRRLSGYKYPPLSANFSLLYPLTVGSVQNNAPVNPGIYELRLKGEEIEYPKGKTNIIYIGSTKNIRKRLKEHLRANNKNGYIRDFLKRFECSFRYIQFSKNWKKEERSLYDFFVTTYGTAPRCNRMKVISWNKND